MKNFFYIDSSFKFKHHQQINTRFHEMTWRDVFLKYEHSTPTSPSKTNLANSFKSLTWKQNTLSLMA